MLAAIKTGGNSTGETIDSRIIGVYSAADVYPKSSTYLVMLHGMPNLNNTIIATRLQMRIIAENHSCSDPRNLIDIPVRLNYTDGKFSGFSYDF